MRVESSIRVIEVAGAELKSTRSASPEEVPKLVPVRVMTSPGAALSGLRRVMVGAFWERARSGTWVVASDVTATPRTVAVPRLSFLPTRVKTPTGTLRSA
ncbi:hypothetical protein D3C86_1460320 [compost metagenome]